MRNQRWRAHPRRLEWRRVLEINEQDGGLADNLRQLSPGKKEIDIIAKLALVDADPPLCFLLGVRLLPRYRAWLIFLPHFF